MDKGQDHVDRSSRKQKANHRTGTLRNKKCKVCVFQVFLVVRCFRNQWPLNNCVTAGRNINSVLVFLFFEERASIAYMAEAVMKSNRRNGSWVLQN